MNCRSFAVALFVSAGLVPMAQTANAGTPTLRNATATATILPVATNDIPDAKNIAMPLQRPTLKYIGADGHVTNIKNPLVRKIVITDLP